MLTPFLVEFEDAKIENLVDRLLVRKRAFLRDFPEAGVDAFDGVRRVHHLAHCAAVIEKLFDVLEIILPHGNGSRIVCPVLLEFGECFPRGFCADSAINRFQLSGESTPALARNVADRIANEMHDAALDDHLGKDGLRTFLQAAHAVHREEAEIADAARLELIEDLHPGMLALCLIDPEAEDVLVAAGIVGSMT